MLGDVGTEERPSGSKEASGEGATFRQSRKSFMPLKLRNISQLSGVSSVMFHRALQENSITWSHCSGERAQHRFTWMGPQAPGTR